MAARTRLCILPYFAPGLMTAAMLAEADLVACVRRLCLLCGAKFAEPPWALVRPESAALFTPASQRMFDVVV